MTTDLQDQRSTTELRLRWVTTYAKERATGLCLETCHNLMISLNNFIISLNNFIISCLSSVLFTWLSYGTTLDSLSALSRQIFAKTIHTNLTGVGGGGLFLSPLSFFGDISRGYNRIIVQFSASSKPSIWHILTKGKIASSVTRP